MSYNTRRSNTGFSSTPQQQPQQNAQSVGQRRPVVTNNFVPGGQLAGNQQQQQQQKPQVQQLPRTPQQQQQQQAGINFRNQAATPAPQSYQTQSYSTQQPQQQQQQPRYQQTLTPVVKQEVRPVQQTPTPQPTPTKPAVAPAAPIVPGANPPAPENNGTEMELNEDGTKKKQWFKNRGKISKAEKVRRRNLRLSKILQPKNAVMILNELVKGCTYNVDELSCKVDSSQFKASVNLEGQIFAGAGRTKNGAKNAAAETALKFLVKNKQLILKKEDDADGGDEKMEIGEEDGNQVMPWTHIASFAMYKLFSTWGEDPTVANTAQELMGTIPKAAGTAVPPGTKTELRPAKKMPDNPEKVNPLMLMNQMLPQAQWDEVGKSGVIPNVVFTFSVTVDGKQYTGTGANKKAAKKMAAYAACHDILKINYPSDVWVPLY